jgi:chromosome segregation ATPase
MGFFTLGNLLTLGIVAVVLVLYRQFDRHNRALDKVHKYAERLKEELAAFVAEKEEAVKDYGILLGVEQKSAKELMNRLHMTDEEMAVKAAAVAKIDERITAYDTSLEELVRMTARVQENLNRIREESAFVEQVNKRVSEAKDKFGSIEKDIKNLEKRFERDNTEALKKAAEVMTGNVQATLSKLGVQAETIEQLVGDTQEALDRAEEDRVANVKRDIDIINHAFSEVMEKTASQAEKMEDTALVKLREQAQERIQRLQASIEEGLRTYQESTKAKLIEIQNGVKANREAWEQNQAALVSQQQVYKDTWKRDVQELNGMVQAQRDAWEAQQHALNEAAEVEDARVRQILSELEMSSQETRHQILAETTAMEQRLKDVQAYTDGAVTALEARLLKTTTEAEQKVSTMTREGLENMQTLSAEADANTRHLLADLRATSDEIRDHFSTETQGMEQRLSDLRLHTDEAIDALRDHVVKAAEETEVRVREDAVARLEQWKQAAEVEDTKARQLLATFESSFAETQQQVSDEIAEATGRIEAIHNRIKETASAIEEELHQAVNDADQKGYVLADARLDQWKRAAEEGDARSRQFLSALESSFGETEKRVSEEIAVAKGQLEALEHKLGETAFQLEAGLRRTVEDAEQKVTALVETQSEQLKQVTEAGGAKAQALLSAFESSLAKTQQHISGEIAEAEGQIERFHDKLDETASRIETGLCRAVEDAEQKASSMVDARLEQWKAAAEAGDAKARERLSALEASFAEAQQHISGEIAEAEGQIERFHDKLDETASHIETGLCRAVEDAEQKASGMVDARLEQWKAAAEAGDAKARERLSALEVSFAQAQQRVFEEIAGAEGQIRTLEQRIDEAAAQIEAGLRTTVEEVQQKAAGMAEARLEQWKAAAEAGDAKARELLDAFESSLAETQQRVSDEIAGAEGRFETFQQKIDETTAHLEADLCRAVEDTERQAVALADSRLEQWKKAADAAETQAREVLAALESSFMGLQKQVSDEIAGSEGRFESLQNRINETVALIDTEMSTAVEDAKQQAQVLADTGLEKWKNAAESAEAQARQLLADLETTSAEARKNISDEITGAEGQLEALHNKISETVSAIEAVMLQAVEDAKQEAQTLADTGLDTWKAAIETANVQTRQLLADLEKISGETEKKLTDLEQRMIRIAGDAEQQVLELTDTRLENWKTVTAEADARTQELLSSLEASSAEIKAHFSAETGEMEQQLKAAQARIDEAIEALNTRIAETIKATETTVLDEVAARLEQYKQTAEEGDAKAQEMLSTLEVSFAAIKTDFTAETETMEQRLTDLKAHTDETIAALESSFTERRQTISDELAGAEGRFEGIRTRLAEATAHIEEEIRKAVDDTHAKLEHHLLQAAEAIEQHVLEETDAKFEEYRTAQVQQFSRLETLADDTSHLDAELRRYMQDTENRVREDFMRFEQDVANAREQTTAEFTASTTTLKVEMERMEQELTALKNTAYEDVSEKFHRFEDDFSADLRTRGDDLNRRFAEWKDDLEAKLRSLAEESETWQRNEDLSRMESLQKQLSQQHEQVVSGLEGQLKTVAERVEGQNHEIAAIMDVSRQNMEVWQSGFTTQLHELDASMNEARRQAQELTAENDERLKVIRSALDDAHTEADVRRSELFARIDEEAKQLDSTIKDADRHIKEFTSQTNLFERADELRLNFEQQIEELRGDFDRLDQHRSEAAETEGQFVKIKRLEDEVNAKMTRFLSEKHRIEQMESDFNRLLQTSKAVEEKLAEVSSSDDAIQGIQIQLRQLNDALKDVEDKYQRIERKNQTLEITNDGIDRNFKFLQESEKMAQYINDELSRFVDELKSIHAAIDILAGENVKARDTAEKLSLLDRSLEEIEKRVTAMNRAREWVAENETRLEDLNKQAQDLFKLMGATTRDGGDLRDKGAPPIGVRETIVKLASQGWSVKEIAQAVKRSRGEVELILEITPKE